MPHASCSEGHAPLGTRCHAVDGIRKQYSKFNFFRGQLRKTSSRPAAPSAPLVSSLKHLECSKGDCGDQRMAICCLSSCKWLDHLQLSISHFWPFNVAKCCQWNSRDNGLNIRKTTRRLTNWPNIATKFARRGTQRRLLLSNWSSWHRAASATLWMEFESNHQSSSSPGESSARLPAGLRPHRHLWCHSQSTWSAQKGTVGIKGWQSVAAPLASDFCKSDHLQLFTSHFWPFNVAKCCQGNSRDNGLN